MHSFAWKRVEERRGKHRLENGITKGERKGVEEKEETTQLYLQIGQFDSSKTFFIN